MHTLTQNTKYRIFKETVAKHNFILWCLGFKLAQKLLTALIKSPQLNFNPIIKLC